jgi:hypothetical protein
MGNTNHQLVSAELESVVYNKAITPSANIILWSNSLTVKGK